MALIDRSDLIKYIMNWKKVFDYLVEGKMITFQDLYFYHKLKNVILQ